MRAALCALVYFGAHDAIKARIQVYILSPKFLRIKLDSSFVKTICRVRSHQNTIQFR